MMMTINEADQTELSQETEASPYQSQVSQDLFQDVPVREPTSQQSNDIKNILKELRLLRHEVGELKAMMKKQSAPFMMSTCSFKNTLHHFLRNLFSKTLWLNVPSEEFQSEIKRCLHRDGWDNDTGVFKTVCSFSYVKFTEFRNQLRRKLAEHKKTDPRSMLLQEFCRSIFAPFVKSGESLLSKERRQNALLIRSYLYRQKHYSADGTGISMTNFSWDQFHVYYQSHLSMPQDKWIKLEELDSKRRAKFQNASESTQAE
ncbi:uncharacterized protein LOC111115362 isoform X1 [Crassostrea virginica]